MISNVITESIIQWYFVFYLRAHHRNPENEKSDKFIFCRICFVTPCLNGSRDEIGESDVVVYIFTEHNSTYHDYFERSIDDHFQTKTTLV